MAEEFQYVFPAIRGTQASREYYVSMCPLRLLPKIFLFNEEEIQPELRAQRLLNKGRIPELTRYIVENPSDYVFSAITASIDSDVEFESMSKSGEGKKMGVLRVPMSAQFIINDGQHRRAAIENALAENPRLGDESIAVVFFLDPGLKRCQQMFADLNRYAIRPARSLGVLYDHRDDKAQVAKMVVAKSSVFKDVVELEKTTLAPRSRKLFTLSAIYTATSALLKNLEVEDGEERAALAVDYWDEISLHMPEWNLVRESKLTAGEVRVDFIHSHGVVLQALGRLGNTLLHHHEADWREPLRSLSKIDWRRSNVALWEGRAMIGGRVTKAQQNVLLTTNAIKHILDLPLNADEARVEEAYSRGEYDRS